MAQTRVQCALWNRGADTEIYPKWVDKQNIYTYMLYTLYIYTCTYFPPPSKTRNSSLEIWSTARKITYTLLFNSSGYTPEEISRVYYTTVYIRVLLFTVADLRGRIKNERK